MTENQETWLTQEAYDRLQAELEELSGPGRREIAARIEDAREEGDLKENGGYHAAKDEQGKMEARIRDLEELLKHATVTEAPQSSGIVQNIAALPAGATDHEYLNTSFSISSIRCCTFAGFVVWVRVHSKHSECHEVSFQRSSYNRCNSRSSLQQPVSYNYYPF